MNEDWLTQQKKEQELLNMSMKESFRQRDERKMKEPYTIIHTKEFNCADDHPIVYYVVKMNYNILLFTRQQIL